MNIDTYQKLAQRTAPETEKNLNDLQRILNHATLGLLSEAGELAGAIKSHIIYGKPLDIENVKEELGDLNWYIALMANALNFTMSDIAACNIEKLKKRYPDKYSDEAALTRADKIETGETVNEFWERG